MKADILPPDIICASCFVPVFGTHPTNELERNVKEKAEYANDFATYP
jgi:hypothetical protein